MSCLTDVTLSKASRETEVARHLRSVSKGPFAEQFSEERLSDAIAMCDRSWDHFKQSSGELLAWALRLPHELAEVVLKKRSSQSQLSVLPAQSESEAAHVHLDASATDFPSGVQQKTPCRPRNLWIQARMHGCRGTTTTKHRSYRPRVCCEARHTWLLCCDSACTTKPLG